MSPDSQVTRRVEGRPELPPEVKGGGPMPTRWLGAEMQRMADDVNDPTVAYGPNEDGYGKCVEVMWRAGYLAHEMMAHHLCVTGFQHSMSRLMLLGQLARLDGPFMIIKLEDALYPQYDIRARVAEWLNEPENLGWLAEQARAQLAKYPPEEDAAPAARVKMHWQALAAYTPPAAT